MKLPLQKTADSPATAPENWLLTGDRRLPEELLHPGNGARKEVACRAVHVRWETPRGRYDAVQQQVFPQKETKVIEPVGSVALQKVVNGARK